MANTPPNLMASGDIRPFRFVKLDPNSGKEGKVLEANANEKVIGICGGSTNQPPLSDMSVTALHAADGQHCKIYSTGDETLLEVADTVVNGNRLKSDNDGCGVNVATTGTTLQEYGAIALESGATGEKIRVFVDLGNTMPAVA